jgi:hypothetical protein
MTYEQIDPRPRAEIQRDLQCPDPGVVVRALLSGALHDSDRGWIEAACIAALSSSNLQIQSAGVTGLVHIARVHRALDLDKVTAEFARVRERPELTGHVDYSLVEIRFFLGLDGK